MRPLCLIIFQRQPSIERKQPKKCVAFDVSAASLRCYLYKDLVEHLRTMKTLKLLAPTCRNPLKNQPQPNNSVRSFWAFKLKMRGLYTSHFETLTDWSVGSASRSRLPSFRGHFRSSYQQHLWTAYPAHFALGSCQFRSPHVQSRVSSSNQPAPE
jgi:hypothetical protein